jgi:putative glutathione S-transferase
VLWDKKTETVVSNESSEIIRMFNSAFDAIAGKPGLLSRRTARASMRSTRWSIPMSTTGSTRLASRPRRKPMRRHVDRTLFDTLDMLDKRLAGNRRT